MVAAVLLVAGAPVAYTALWNIHPSSTSRLASSKLQSSAVILRILQHSALKRQIR